MSKTTVIILIVIILAGGAYYFWNKQSAPMPEAMTTEVAPKEFVLNIVGKKLVSGPETLSVNKGDTIVIRVTNDEAEELHVHGYDKSVELEPGVQAELTFVADVVGRFHAELEESKTEIATLEVLP